jgi:protein-disulfide isomerase
MSKRNELRERRQRQRRRQTIIVILIVVGAALIITALLILPSLQPVGAIATASAYSFPAQSGQAMGDPNAPVKMEEYSDFQCPYCRQFHNDTFRQIIDTYVRTGKVYFVFRNFPIVDRSASDQESHTAANAAVCAGQQGKFFEYHDLLFANQTGENIGDFTVKRVQAMASTLGLDTSKFNACLNDSATANTVAQDFAAGVKAGVDSTPSFMVNGQLVKGALPFAQFQTAIDAALAAPK